MGQVIVLLPSLNEEEGIGEVIDRIQKIDIQEKGYSIKILVIDGNSTDKTREISESKGAEVILQSDIGGKGIGVREAINHILKISKVILMMLIKRDSVAATTSLLFLVPPVTAVIAFFIFGDPLTPVTGSGFLMASVGVYLVTFYGASDQKT